MQYLSSHERFQRFLTRAKDGRDCERLDDKHDGNESIEEDIRRPVLVIPDEVAPKEAPFSWADYCVFILLGIVMLWAWNMFLAAAPYFQARFAQDSVILTRFQPAITSINCITTFFSMLILTRIQTKANYSRRITIGLVLSLLVFSLLSISTSNFRGVSAKAYFAFTLVMVSLTAIATSLCQNGAFALAAGFGRVEYIQAILTGQAIAGVLPSVAQIISVLLIPKSRVPILVSGLATAPSKEITSAALTYFLTATTVSIATLLAVIPLIRKHNRLVQHKIHNNLTGLLSPEGSKRKSISLWTLYKKLNWLAASIFLCFAVSMFFPVFTEKIVSIVPEDRATRLLQRAAFIPLGFLTWNIGDLLGRLMTLGPMTNMWRMSPTTLFIFVSLRAIYIPLYFLCNIGGHGATVQSDTFYLLFVSGGFGATNGFFSSICLTEATMFVEDEEREVSSGFMILNLQAGLMVGSLLSFTFSGF